MAMYIFIHYLQGSINCSYSHVHLYSLSGLLLIAMGYTNIKHKSQSSKHALEVLYGTLSYPYMHDQSVNHISLKNRPRCYVKSPTGQIMFTTYKLHY